MRRISSGMNNMDVQSRLRLQEYRLNKVSNQVTDQRRLQELREDPIAAGHLVRHQSFEKRISQFENNSRTLVDRYAYRDSYINDTVQIVQRIRELAVQGAHGTYSPEDLKNMAGEVDGLLKQIIQNANAVDQDGNALFAGTKTNVTPFEIEMGNVDGSGIPLIANVVYNGNVAENKVEVDEGQFMYVNNSGNRTFWAEKQQLTSSRGTTQWVSENDGLISIDGKEIEIRRGDNIYSVISKINNSPAAVKASLDPITQGLTLVTTDARQLWLEDVQGTVLSDLGVISSSEQRPPYNYATGTRISGGSLFDSVIALRNAMLTADQETIGGSVLGRLDAGLSNLVARNAEVGTQYERALQNVFRNTNTSLNLNRIIAREGDLDFTKAVTDMRMMEYTHQASLSIAGRMYQSTLLNFMR